MNIYIHPVSIKKKKENIFLLNYEIYVTACVFSFIACTFASEKTKQI